LPPSALVELEKFFGTTVVEAYGMTEAAHQMSCNRLPPGIRKPGTVGLPTGLEITILDDEGKSLPWDGTTFGRLMVRGPAISKGYYRVNTNILDKDGYFDTGDVAVMQKDSYMRITDRSKDVIKSGGEWISSIDLENLAVGHPKVAEAAVIGMHHPKWDERPLLIVQVKAGQTLTKEESLKFMDGKIAKWWMPDDVQFVEEIPHTATGKIKKTDLRTKFKDYRFPSAAA